MPSGILRRFLLAMALLALAPSIFMGLLLIRTSRSGMQGAVLELHTKLAEKTAERIADYLKNIDDKILFTLSALNRPGLDWQSRQEILRSLLETRSDIAEISVVRHGVELLKVYNPDLGGESRAVERGAQPLYKEFLRARKRTLGVTTESGRIPSLEMYYPFSPVADVRVRVLLRSLWQSIAAERVGGTGFAMLVGKDGRPLIYPADRLSPKALKELPRWPIVAAARLAQTVGSGEYRDPDGNMQVGAYAPVPEISGAVVIQQPYNEAYLAAIRMKRAAGSIIALICVAAALIALGMARALTRPLLALTRASEKVAQGGFPEEVRLGTGDELQELADTFNRMVARLRSYAELQVDRMILEQKKTEAILFSIGDGILVTDNEGKIQLANRKAVEILGKAGEQIEGKPLAQILPPEGKLKGAVLQVMANPSGQIVKEVDLSTEQSRLFLRLSARPLVSPSKNIVLGVITALHDVTLEKELDKMKEEFLHSITHDLRNPIGSIIGFLDFLRKGVVGVLNAQQSSMVESMHKSASRLLAMINNILDIAKMEAGKIELDIKTASLAGLASHALEILGSLAQRRGIKMDLAAEEEFSMELDASQIERVLSNLVGNAIKFAPDDGKVTVTINDLGDRLQVCVADNGPGIPQDYLEKVFEKFEQVPGHRRGGTGLGLTISRIFVEAHRGRIWVESDLGHGARFYFTLPKGLVKDERGEVVVRAAMTDA